MKQICSHWGWAVFFVVAQGCAAEERRSDEDLEIGGDAGVLAPTWTADGVRVPTTDPRDAGGRDGQGEGEEDDPCDYDEGNPACTPDGGVDGGDGEGCTATMQMLAETARIHDFTVDDGYVYFTGLTAVYTGRVWRVPTSGGAPVALVAERAATTSDIVVDATHVYFTEWDATAADDEVSDSVVRVAKDGGLAEVIISNGGRELAIDSEYVYFLSVEDGLDPSVRRWSKATGAIEHIADAPAGAKEFVLADGVLYWSHGSETSGLSMVPATGGVPVEVAGPIDGDPKYFDVDATSLYIAVERGGDTFHSYLRKDALVGPGAEELVSLVLPVDIEEDAGVVFFADVYSGDLMSVASTGGATTVLAAPADAKAWKLEVVGDCVYFSINPEGSAGDGKSNLAVIARD